MNRLEELAAAVLAWLLTVTVIPIGLIAYVIMRMIPGALMSEEELAEHAKRVTKKPKGDQRK